MTQKSLLERHPRIAVVTLMCIVCVLTLLALEYGFRFARDWVKGSAWISRAENIDDDVLGWALNPNKQVVVKKNVCGEDVVRKSPATRYLNKRAQEGVDSRSAVLFIGDSFTQGTEVSSDAIYYEIFEQLGGGVFSVSAAGIGGIGTVQEYLLLKKVYDVVKPHVVFWQLTSNDIGENVFDGVDISGVQKPRPYYDKSRDAFIIENPAFFLFQWSELAKYLYGELLKIERSHPFGLGKVLGWIGSPTLSLGERERRGFEVMDQMLEKARKHFPSVIFVGFSSDDAYQRQYQTLFEKYGFLYISNFSDTMRSRAGQVKLDCSPIDSHWNHEGNRVAATLLLEFANREVLPLLNPNSRQLSTISK